MCFFKTATLPDANSFFAHLYWTTPGYAVKGTIHGILWYRNNIFLFCAYGAIAVSTLPVIDCFSKYLRIFGRFNLGSENVGGKSKVHNLNKSFIKVGSGLVKIL